MHSNDSEMIFNISGYKRKPTLAVRIGDLGLGGENPIRLQTMTTTNTNSINESVEQCLRAIDAGAELIRLTTQGVKEVESLAQIKKIIREKGVNTPIVADIHFNPAAAIEAAKYADKIRINPGNYSDKSRTSNFSFTNSDYEAELERAEKKFLELLQVCKQNQVTIRIGVNHGSLSQRIMNRYGDTPLGMAISAMEFVRICNRNNHHKVVVSMKSSNTRVMVQATRYVVKMMVDEGFNYPMHLGVTEAGEGEDGRIKSAVGIGTLLVDGIGDTIRVSLTEEPENEIPVARELVNIFGNWPSHHIKYQGKININPFEYKRRETHSIHKIGGNNVPVVVANLSNLKVIDGNTLKEWGWQYNAADGKWEGAENSADFIYIGSNSLKGIESLNGLPTLGNGSNCLYKVLDQQGFVSEDFKSFGEGFFVKVNPDEASLDFFEKLKSTPSAIIILNASNPYQFYSLRNFIFRLVEMGINNPCIISIHFPNINTNNFQIASSAIAGPFFIDGLSDGLMISAPQEITQSIVRSTAFGILQASRVRISKTEFISCPGCGRTLFNLNQTLLKVKERTAHLKGLKIGVMGCIVNGPGEMADADYGYVGSGPGKVTLYKQKEVVKKNIPESKAVEELIALIKANGDWVDNANKSI